MVFVINGGKADTKQFITFVDLCCKVNTIAYLFISRFKCNSSKNILFKNNVMDKLDQGHFHPLLEHPETNKSRPGIEPGPPPAPQASRAL
jgi:hypothetical protein